MCFSGHRVLMTQLFVLRSPGASKARESHAKFQHVALHLNILLK